MKVQYGNSWFWRSLGMFAVGLCFGLALVAEQSGAPDTTAAPHKAPAPNSGTKEEYVIGPEDILAINVWREDEISRTVPVRPDGKISLPLIGDLQASGLTPAALEAKVKEELEEYISNPEVTVIVQQIHSRKFNVVGKVLRPGSYPLNGSVSVLDAIALAGGFQEFANVKKIFVLRRLQGGEEQVLLPFNYKDVIRGKKLHQNIEIRPRDTIIVP